MTDWSALTTTTLEQLKDVDPMFRPTNFWGPGLTELLHDMETEGLENFKRWPTAPFWFYPMYGNGYTPEQIDQLVDAARPFGQSDEWLRSALRGTQEARRDLHAARLLWNRKRWPIRLLAKGEKRVGNPRQGFKFGPHRPPVTRPYLNYMLCMAALSNHVDGPPKRVLELGGGFGALGEFLMSRDTEVIYVDLDIPPLVTVAAWYLNRLHGDRVLVPDNLPDGPLEITQSAVLPNWRLPDVQGPFDVFVNSYSFQEMEPDVVANYIRLVAEKDVEFVVSLNSRNGKPKHDTPGHRSGVIEPVTSAFIAGEFEKHGYTVLRRDGQPVVHSAGELLVMRRATPPAPAPSVVQRVRGKLSRG